MDTLDLVVKVVRKITSVIPRFLAAAANFVIATTTRTYVELEIAIHKPDAVYNVSITPMGQIVRFARQAITEMLSRKIVRIVSVTFWERIEMLSLVITEQDSVLVYLTLLAYIVILVKRIIGRLLVVKVVNLASVTQLEVFLIGLYMEN